MEFNRTARKPPTVSIVPLIDILVTLLFFFIVTMKDPDDFEKKKLKPEIQVSLPSAHSMKVTTTKQTRSTLSLGKDGSAELNDATFRGQLDVQSASSGSRLEIDGDQIRVYEGNTLRVVMGRL